MTTITVETRHGRKDIRARVIGQCAVHHELARGEGEFYPDSYSVTHVQSGFRICSFRLRKDATAFARAIKALGLDIDSLVQTYGQDAPKDHPVVVSLKELATQHDGRKT